MRETTLPGDPPINVILRRSAGAKRITLRVSSLDGRVTLSVPKGIPDTTAMAFAQEKNDWIRKHLDKHQVSERVEIGHSIMFEGRQVPIKSAQLRSPKFEDEILWVPPAADMVGARIKAFLKLHAKKRLTTASHYYAEQVGRTVGKITIRDTRSRWGSCTAQGNLNYSWRLAMAPPDVLDYVAAHEVAHLIELNHSAAYWEIVKGIFPGYQARRDWLRENGAHLHKYRFND